MLFRSVVLGEFGPDDGKAAVAARRDGRSFVAQTRRWVRQEQRTQRRIGYVDAVGVPGSIAAISSAASMSSCVCAEFKIMSASSRAGEPNTLALRSPARSLGRSSTGTLSLFISFSTRSEFLS